MKQPLKEFVFRPSPDLWVDAGTGRVLADVLAYYELLIDDRTQFARIYDYDAQLRFYYRATAGKVTLTIWEMEE